MKFTATLPMAAAICFAAAPLLSSCSDDHDDEKYEEIDLEWNNSGITFDQEGIWNGVDNDNDLTIGLFNFSHGYDGYPFGFTASRAAGNQNFPGQMPMHSFTVMPGCGTDGANSPFIIGYWDSYQEQKDGAIKSSCEITMKNPDGTLRSFFPQEVDVTNTCYTYYTMLEGNEFAKKFEEKDWLKLVAIGISVDGGERKAEFYLAKCVGPDKSTWFVKDWREFDLTTLGEVISLRFSMQSSDSGIYGMNTPAYFAIDDLDVIVKK